MPHAAPLRAGIFLLPYSPSQSRPSARNNKGDPEAAYRNPLIGKGGFGGCTRTRTLDPLIKSQLLYHLSYAPGAS